MTNDVQAENTNQPSPPSHLAPADGGAAGAAARQQTPQGGVLSSQQGLENGVPPLYRPDELDQGLVGSTDKETIERLMAALKDHRTKAREQSAPEKLEDYADFSGVELPETIAGHLQDLGNDPLFKTAAQAAQKHGVSQAAMQEIVRSVYASAAENGLLEPTLDVEAERLALVPEGYANQPKERQDGAINARLQANVDYLSLLIKNGKIDNETAEHVAGMLMDTAKGNKFLEFVRQQATGGGLAQPFGNQAAMGGANSQAALRDELARVQAKKGTIEYDPKEHDAVMARYRNLYGD